MTRPNKKGMRYLRLNYYLKGKRKLESLSVYTFEKENLSPEERSHNRTVKAYVEKKRLERATQLVDCGNNLELLIGEISFVNIYYKDVIVKNNFHIAAYKKFKSFIFGMSKHDITTAEITKDLIKKYKDYLLKCGISVTTAHHYFNSLKASITSAMYDGFIRNNPFIGVSSIKLPRTKTIPLTIDELNSIRAYKNTSNVIKLFDFSASTGIRMCDLKRLKYSNLVGDEIRLTQKKTSEILVLPFTEKTRELIDTSKIGSDEFVFNIPSAYYLKKELDNITSIINIQKKVTFKTARRTFAQLFYEESGDIYLTSNALGHSNIMTTMLYLNFSQKKIKQILDKLDEKRGNSK